MSRFPLFLAVHTGRTTFSIFALLIGSVVLTACGGLNLSGEPEIVATIPRATVSVTTPEPLYPDSPPDVALGAVVFSEHCTACHGINGAGDGALVLAGQVPNPGNMTLLEAVDGQTPQDWYEIITNGNLEKLMPPWGNSLSAEERWAVALYTYTLHHTAEQLALGEQVYLAECAECHGERGEGEGQRSRSEGLDASRLNDPYNMVTLRDRSMYFMVAEGVAEAMPAYQETLTEAEMWASVAYTRTLALTNAQAIGQVITPVPTATVAPSPTPPTAPYTANIIGQVANGTDGAVVPSGATVTLYILDESFVPLETFTTTTDASGAFTFGEMTIQPSYIYVVGVDHTARQFFSDPLPGYAPTDENGAFALPILIFDLTDDPSVLSITRMVSQITAQADRLQITEVVFFNNSSDRVYSAAEPLAEGDTRYASTVLTLPPGAVVAGFGGENPERYLIDDAAFRVTDTQPVLPGEGHSMQVVYFIPYDSNGAIIERPLEYPLSGTARLLVNPPNLQINGATYPRLGEITLGENNYTEYGGDVALAANDTLRYEVRGNSSLVNRTDGTPLITTTPNTAAIAAFTIAGVAALAGIGLFLYSRLAANPEQARQRQINALMSQITTLDRDHEAGRLNHDVWHAQRNTLKEQIKQLMESESPTP